MGNDRLALSEVTVEVDPRGKDQKVRGKKAKRNAHRSHKLGKRKSDPLDRNQEFVTNERWGVRKDGRQGLFEAGMCSREAINKECTEHVW